MYDTLSDDVEEGLRIFASSDHLHMLQTRVVEPNSHPDSSAMGIERVPMRLLCSLDGPQIGIGARIDLLVQRAYSDCIAMYSSNAGCS